MNDVKGNKFIGGRSKKPYWAEKSCICEKVLVLNYYSDCPRHGKTPQPRLKFISILGEIHYEEGEPDYEETRVLCIRFANEHNLDVFVRLTQQEARKLNDELRQIFQ